MKGSSTEHFLIESWNAILTTLEEKDMAANLMSVDFSKAFNRMDHFCCLTALSDMGAQEETIDWVASFLHNRTMSVKIGTTMSKPRTVPGGSPQGSILGNFLFCVTTDKFTMLNGDPRIDMNALSTTTDSEGTPNLASGSENDSLPTQAITDAANPCVVSTPTTRGQFARFLPPSSLANLSGEYESDEDEFDFFRVKRRHEFDTTSSEEASIYESINRESGIYHSISTYVYIDDFNAIESIDLRGALSHITERKCELRVRAKASENLFEKINLLASDIGMQVNGQKTQMLCIHPCVHNKVSTHLVHQNAKIQSGQDMKILGFTFDKRPNANKHVEVLIERFYNRLWTLRFLKRSGLKHDHLLEIYNSVLRSAVEYCSTVYHSMIPRNLTEKLERIQRQALKIIYGWDKDIGAIMKIKDIPTLEERREKALLQFALKNEEKERYGKRWFKKSEETDREVRGTTRRKYKIPKCRTDRMQNNPVVYMAKKLNEHYSA